MIQDYLPFTDYLPWVGLFVGLCLGSFLNVVAYRVPRDLSIIRPGSYCTNCSVPIPWSFNIPVFGWLMLKGKARCCGSKISPRYFLVELIVGLIFAWIFHRFSVDHNLGLILASSIFAWLLIAVIVIDFETMLIPDRFSIGGACIGLILSFYFPNLHGIEYHPLGMESLLGGVTSFIGILVGSGFLYWIGAVASRSFGKEALGEGDIKLLGCIGAFCGWKGAIFCIFGGALVGTVLLIPIYIWQKFCSQKERKGQLDFGMEIPFGPYLAMAALGYFFCLKPWVDLWFEWLGQIGL